MYSGSTEFKRCCFCLPLRRGLIGWGYVRLILDIWAAICLIGSTVWMLKHRTSDPWVLALILTIIISLIIDAVFTVLLITGALMVQNKSAKLLRISYIYSVVWLILLMIFVTYFVLDGAVWRLKSFYEYGYDQDLFVTLLANTGILYSLVFVQMYVTLLTRSEAIKLRKQALEVQFVNNAAEGEARCVRADTTDGAAQDSDCTQDTAENMECKSNMPIVV